MAKPHWTQTKEGRQRVKAQSLRMWAERKRTNRTSKNSVRSGDLIALKALREYLTATAAKTHSAIEHQVLMCGLEAINRFARR